MKLIYNAYSHFMKMTILLPSLIIGCIELANGQQSFDLILKGGRVIDPETKLDAIRNIGIIDNRITEISLEALTGKEIIDVTGLVVSPGFIDLHVHGVTNMEQEYQMHDGVTTALELEMGMPFLREWYASRTSKSIINYGASVSWPHNRIQTSGKFDVELGVLKKSRAQGEHGDKKIWKLLETFDYEQLPPDMTKVLLDHIRSSLADGGIGIGMPVGYLLGATRDEVFKVYQLAGELQAPIFTHVRKGKTMAIQQAISDAVITRAPLHIEHINSMALDEIKLAIEMVTLAQKRGFDITTEIYPYTAGSTGIESPMFNEGWQDRMGISYNELQWVATGERLTEKTFSKYRKEGGKVIIHLMKPEWIKYGISSKETIIASDGMPYSKLAHPRTAGTFSRVLGKYVREDHVISLEEAISKMTILPAKRLEGISPMMRFKGRIQIGSDADITIFDPKTINDKATFENGLEFSEGIKYVIVNGILVIRDGQTIKNTFPGQPVYGKFKN